MVKIISFINRKGGVGKTTAVVNLGGYLAKKLQKRVLVIDIDPQSSASSWLMTQNRYLAEIENSPDKPQNSIYQIFNDAIYNENKFNKERGIQKGVVKNARGRILIPSLDLIPSVLRMDYLEREIVSYNDLKVAILYEKLINDEIIEDYDYILIDCPPNMGTGSQNAIFASDLFIIPTIADPISTQGFPELIHTLDRIKEITGKRREDHKKPICGGIIISHFRNTNTVKNTLNKLNELIDMFQTQGKLHPEAAIFEQKITYLTAIPDTQGKGTILPVSSPRTKSHTEFEDLMFEFFGKFPC